MNAKFSEQKRNRKGYYLDCETCGREFYIFPSRLRRTKKDGIPRFCSMGCYDKHGEKNPFHGKRHSIETRERWIGSALRSALGRRRAVQVIDQNKNIIGCKKKEMFISEKGKCERCGFGDLRVLIIHHKDRNRKNNNRMNLEVICPNCHFLEHYLAKDGMYSLRSGGSLRCA